MRHYDGAIYWYVSIVGVVATPFGGCWLVVGDLILTKFLEFAMEVSMAIFVVGVVRICVELL